MNDSSVFKSLLSKEIEKREQELSALKSVLQSLDGSTSQSIETGSATAESALTAESTSKTPVKKVARRPLSKKRKGSLIGVIMSLLKKQKRFMDSRELSDIISKKHPNLVKDEAKFEKYLAVVLSNYKRKGELSGIKKNHKGEKLTRTFWGIYNWVDTEGNPLDTIALEA